MAIQFLLIQVLNGLQTGVLLFMLSAGLTLVLGILGFLNLMHGTLYMLGAYLVIVAQRWTGSLLLAIGLAILGTVIIGLVVERLVFSKLYDRTHLDHVLGTFGLTLFFNEIARMIWGSASLSIDLPDALTGTVPMFGVQYPVYRLLILAIGGLVGVGLYLLIHRSRMGMRIRAAASHPGMTSALGIDVRRLRASVVALGAGLAALAGLLSGPLGSVEPTMGDSILIMTLVVIVVGGIGSVAGAFYAAILIGVIDTLGRSLLPLLLRQLMERSVAQAAGAALASVLIYFLMALVLMFRPQGLFPVRHG